MIKKKDSKQGKFIIKEKTYYRNYARSRMEDSSDSTKKKKSKKLKCTTDGMPYLVIIAKKHRLKIIAQLDTKDPAEDPTESNKTSDIFQEKHCKICGILLDENRKYCLNCRRLSSHRFDPQACLDWDNCIVLLEDRHCDKCEKRRTNEKK